MLSKHLQVEKKYFFHSCQGSVSVHLVSCCFNILGSRFFLLNCVPHLVQRMLLSVLGWVGSSFCFSKVFQKLAMRNNVDCGFLKKKKKKKVMNLH